MNTKLKSQTRLVLLATVAAGALVLGGLTVASAADAMHSPSTLANSSDAQDGNVAERITHLHALLKITPAQEVQWSSVAQVMRDNAMSMDKALKERAAKAKDLSAVDDLTSFQAITQDHADGLKKLVDAFAPLYAAMSPEQQKNADAVFKHRTEAAASRLHK